MGSHESRRSAVSLVVLLVVMSTSPMLIAADEVPWIGPSTFLLEEAIVDGFEIESNGTVTDAWIVLDSDGSDYCLIITDNGFEALYAANRIVASVREKARTHPLKLAGLIGNRTRKRNLIDKYVESCPIPVLEIIPIVDGIQMSRIQGQTVFEIAEKEKPLSLVCDFYLNIADQLLTQPEGVVPTELPDQELFRLLSNTTSKSTETKSNLDFMLV